MPTITVTITDDEGEEQEHDLPAKNEVCWDCEGEGMVLREGMRHHAYTQEEFDDAFSDPDDRAEYFRRGGIYDVKCSTCKGDRVTRVPDRDACTEKQKEVLDLWEEQQEEQAAWDAEDRAIRRMENGGYDY